MTDAAAKLIALDPSESIWERFFTVFPLVVVGSVEEDGAIDLAPKHLAMPMSWQNHFGFVCTPSHRTYQNVQRTGEFTVLVLYQACDDEMDDVRDALEAITSSLECEGDELLFDE